MWASTPWKTHPRNAKLTAALVKPSRLLRYLLVEAGQTAAKNDEHLK